PADLREGARPVGRRPGGARQRARRCAVPALLPARVHRRRSRCRAERPRDRPRLSGAARQSRRPGDDDVALGPLPRRLHGVVGAQPRLPPAHRLCAYLRWREGSRAVPEATGVPAGPADDPARAQCAAARRERSRRRRLRGRRGADLGLAFGRLLHGVGTERGARAQRQRDSKCARKPRRGTCTRRGRRQRRARRRAGRCRLRRRGVTFERPWLLLSLLLVPLAVALYVLAERRRMRYAVRFTNVDVLAGVVRGRIWRRFVPLVFFLLAVASLCVATARPQRTTLVPKDRATVILVVDVSRS